MSDLDEYFRPFFQGKFAEQERLEDVLLRQGPPPAQLGKLSADRKKVELPDGTIQDAIIYGSPTDVNPVVDIGDGKKFAPNFFVQASYQDGPLGELYAILVHFQDGSAKYFLTKSSEFATPAKYYAIDTLTIANTVSGFAFGDFATLKFTPNGKHIFVAFDNSLDGAAIQWGFALNWSLTTDIHGNRLVAWTGLTQKALTLNESTLPTFGVPSAPSPPPDSPASPGFTCPPDPRDPTQFPAISFRPITQPEQPSRQVQFNYIVYDTSTGPQCDVVGNWRYSSLSNIYYMEVADCFGDLFAFQVGNFGTVDYIFQSINADPPLAVFQHSVTEVQNPPISYPFPSWYRNISPDRLYTRQTVQFGEIWTITPEFKYQKPDLSFVSASLKSVDGTNFFWVVEDGNWLKIPTGEYSFGPPYIPAVVTDQVVFLGKSSPDDPDAPPPHTIPPQWLEPLFSSGIDFLNIRAKSSLTFQTLYPGLAGPIGGTPVKAQKWTWDPVHLTLAAGANKQGATWDTSQYTFVDFLLR